MFARANQLHSLVDKPWRKPGADLTDYFNYGFDEDTWRAYIAKQVQQRMHRFAIAATVRLRCMFCARHLQSDLVPHSHCR